MARIRGIGRKLLLTPVIAAALVVTPMSAPADDVASNQLGQRMSGGKAASAPPASNPDRAAPPAGAGSGRKIR